MLFINSPSTHDAFDSVFSHIVFKARSTVLY